jgi:aspartyl-tRNA(Asn)/glutamyl-tRNA(Gln) amidotransferase subunit B
MNFETVIGLEIHVELKTDSKMFSPSPNHFGAEPNTNTHVIDLGYPGVLPVVNKRAIDYGMKAALALNCEISTHTKFDRKNYFYPDNPKARGAVRGQARRAARSRRREGRGSLHR